MFKALEKLIVLLISSLFWLAAKVSNILSFILPENKREWRILLFWYCVFYLAVKLAAVK